MLNLHLLNPFRVWPLLPFLPRLFSFFLFGIASYVVIRLVGVGWRQQQIRILRTAKPAPAAMPASTAADTLENIRQLRLFTFYLFAVILFAYLLPNAFVIFGDSHRTGYSIVLEQLDVTFSYSADVMLVLLFLHSLQWIVSARVVRVARKLSEPR